MVWVFFAGISQVSLSYFILTISTDFFELVRIRGNGLGVFAGILKIFPLASFLLEYFRFSGFCGNFPRLSYSTSLDSLN